DPTAGGGGGRKLTTVAESNKNGFTLLKSGNIGGRLGVSRLFHGMSPWFVVTVTKFDQSAGVPTAMPALSPLARAIKSSATCLPNASPAEMSALVAAPLMIVAC